MNGFNGFNGYTGGMWSDKFTAEAFYRRQKETENLKKLGFYTGAAILGTIIIQNALIMALSFSGLYGKYFSDGIFASGFDILMTVVSLLLPFVLVGRSMSRYASVPRVFYLGGPYRSSMMIPAVVAGVGCCMGANIVTNYISVIFNNFGYEPSSVELNMPDGLGGFIMSLFRIVIVAGVVEEVIMRGYTLGSLRFYGDKFAILMSSIVFALIHGNFTQIPFALISAFGLGYFTVKTGTIWTGVIIHIVNNLISVIFYYMPNLTDESVSVFLQLIIIYGLVIAGIIALAVFNSKTKDVPLNQGGSILTKEEKLKAYFINVPMIISVLYFVLMSVLGVAELE